MFLWKDVLKYAEHLCRSFIEITFLLWCSFVNLLNIFRTVSPKNALGLLLKIEMNKRQKGDIKIQCNRNYVYYSSFDVFISFPYRSKYKYVKAIEDDFYHKVIEAKCTEVVPWRCSIKMEFLEISLRRFTGKHYARVSFLIKLQDSAWPVVSWCASGYQPPAPFILQNITPSFLSSGGIVKKLGVRICRNSFSCRIKYLHV